MIEYEFWNVSISRTKSQNAVCQWLTQAAEFQGWELDRLRRERAAEGRDLTRVGSVDPLIRALAGDDPRAVVAHLGNDLEAAALSLMPTLRRTLRAGAEAGALHGMVSGSGPTCVFFCADHDSALAVATELSGAGVAREVRLATGPAGGARLLDTPTRK